MRSQTGRILSTILSATTVMSMLTFAPAGVIKASAADEVLNQQLNAGLIQNVQQATEPTTESVTELSTEQPATAQYESAQMLGGTGDRTFELEELPEDVEVIGSAQEYYQLVGKKYKVPSGGSLKAALPASVDNSQSEYFPKIDSQGGIGACVAWAQSYYQFTYHMNKSRGVPTTPENTFSPKFTYNIANGGKDKGSFTHEVYKLMKCLGNVPITMVPYDNDCFEWSATKEIWREAIRYRIKDYQYFDEIGTSKNPITSADDDDLTAIKTALSNGDVLTYSTHISDWKVTKLKTNSAAPENSKFAGQEAVTHQAGSNGGHRMTLVGYNDDIWVDVNANNAVDTGEMGAFKIANSWGDDYGNGGFMWISYDALNEKTAVSNGPATRVRIFTNIGRIDVKEYNPNEDIYLVYTLNTGDRANANAIVIAEKDGTKYTDYAIPIVSWENIAFGYDGTAKASDGTMVFALSNIIPDITSEKFHDYTWRVEFIDDEKNNIPLTVKNAEIVDEFTNKVYKPANVYPFTLENDRKEVTINETSSNNVVVYYRGLYNPKINFKIGNSDWQTVEMEDNIERAGYTQKYVIELEEKADVKIYFSDDKGNTDTNNGSYYVPQTGLNYFVTENAADPLKVDVELKDMPVDIKKMLDFIATASGGYAPYQYKFEIKNLDNGEVKSSNFVSPYGVEDTSYYKYGYSFGQEGNYRITVSVQDYTGNISSSYIEKYIDDKPFEYTTFTATPDKHVMVGDTVELTATTNFENIIYVGRPKNQHSFVIKNESGQVVYTKSFYAQVYSMNYKTSTPTLLWVPTKAGSYTVTVSTTDGSNCYAEKTLKLTVTDYNGTLIGDADNSGSINLTDALLVMKYNVGGIDESKLWFMLADSNDDTKVDLRDAIYILKYTISSGDVANVGKVNFRETPTDPPTEPPTQKPTEAPTSPVVKNIVTFTNSHRWGGTMYCYYWSDSDKNMAVWPGKAMTSAGINEFGEALYTFELPKEANYVIFTNGSYQTVDISYKGGTVRYYPTTTNSKGHYNVKTW
ncbi:MAG: starch-binding protein [Acutalibacteraceae bacterium]|nr:starch-binding protein [Acutalibacteraceae bacterium]